MADSPFDDIAKARGSLTSRRLTLGAFLSGALGLHGLADSEAKKAQKNNGHGNKGGGKGGDRGNATQANQRAAASGPGGAETEQKKKKKSLCHCPDGNPSTCVTLKVSTKARQKHLKQHPFDRPGACPPVTSTTPSPETTTTTTPPPGTTPRTWPPASWRPYASSSPFNTPIPTAPKVHPNSAAIVDRILGDLSKENQPANLIAHVDGSSGEPTYYSQPTDPEYTLKATMTQWGSCPIDGHTLRIPAGAQVEGNRAAAVTNSNAYIHEPDAHVTIVDQASGWEYDLWQVHRNPLQGGGELQFSWGGRTRLDGDGLAAEGNATAAHFGSLAGRLRAEELEAGEINHALAVVLACDSGEIVYPAKGHGQRCADTVNAPPMGARLQLNMSVDEINALPVPAWKKALLRAMARYGMFFMDTGTKFYFTIEQEAGNQYQSLGYPDKWTAVAEQLGWSYFGGDSSYPHPNWTGRMRNTDDGIDWTARVWSRLRVVET